jgi:hypothetical protein
MQQNDEQIPELIDDIFHDDGPTLGQNPFSINGQIGSHQTNETQALLELIELVNEDISFEELITRINNTLNKFANEPSGILWEYNHKSASFFSRSHNHAPLTMPMSPEAFASERFYIHGNQGFFALLIRGRLFGAYTLVTHHLSESTNNLLAVLCHCAAKIIENRFILALGLNHAAQQSEEYNKGRAA